MRILAHLFHVKTYEGLTTMMLWGSDQRLLVLALHHCNVSSLASLGTPHLCSCSQIYCHLWWPATDLKSLLICCHVSVEPVERWQNVPYWMLPCHPSHDPWEFTLLIDLNLFKYVAWISTRAPICNCQCSFQQCCVGSRKLHWDHRSTLPVLQVCKKSFCCMFLLWYHSNF